MKRRIISLIMATLLFLSVFSGYNEIFASEEKNNYIVHIDVESILTGYEQALRNEDFDKAITIAGEALDKFEASLKNVKHYEVYDRIKLLVPSLCIKASQDTINQIKLMPNVIDVYEDEEFYIQNDMDQNHYKTKNAFKPMRIGSNDLIGNDSMVRSKYDGRGQVLAVIDGNMDPSHEAFYLSDGVKGKLSYEDIEDRITGRDGKITLEAKGNAIKKDDPWVNKVPFGYDYYNFSTSLNPEKEKKGHGEHVAGTMGGNRTKAFGEDWQGVAPNAQLLFLRCMHEGTTTPSSYIKASVDAVILGASAANLSLGSTKGLPGTVDKLLTNLIDTNYLKNTNFVIAAGNEGEFQGNMSIDNPDYGTISNPGIATNAITVASLENKTMYAYGLTNERNEYQYNTSSNIDFKEGDYEYIYCGKGEKDDFLNVDVNGKVALVSRGGNSFTEKVLNAEENGAVGVIVANNVSGLFFMDVKGNTIPAISVDMKTGDSLRNASDKTVNISLQFKKFNNPEFGEMSAFTNWGLSIGGFMKPDITAPGGHILSAENNVDGTVNNSYGDMSGTSMATPHVSGGVAVVRQYMESDPKFKDVIEKAKLTKILLMNSAVPHQDPQTFKLTSPRRQGAGVMNLKNATELDFTVVSKKSGIPSEFVGDVNDKIKLNLTVKNYSSSIKNITPSVAATIEAREGKKLSFRPEDLFSDTLTGQAFTIKPGEEKDITIEFPIRNLDKIEPFKNGAFIDGFINFKDQNNMIANFAFVSFKGDYGMIPSVEKPIYEFDFETEYPMWWNYKFTQKDWFNYGTLLLTESGFGKDGNPEYKIAGIKNFDDIKKNKNTDQEPKPEFEPLVFSPNNDGLSDNINLNLVMTRAAYMRLEFLNEEGKRIAEDFLGVRTKNFSFMPEDDDPNKIGYLNIGELYLDRLNDGKYTLNIKSSAIKDSIDLYNETDTKFNFIIDREPPEFNEASLNNNNLKFKVKDKSFVRNVKYKTENGDFEFIDVDADGFYTINLPKDVDLNTVVIESTDGGYNTAVKTAEQIINSDKYGAVTVNVIKNSYEALDLEYKIYDESGKEYEVTHPKTTLPIGRYELEVVNSSDLYKLTSPTTQSFEIREGKKEAKINLEFERTGRKKVSIHLTDFSDLTFDDFDLIAIDVEHEDKIYEFKNYITMQNRYNVELPYGYYNFKLRLKDPKKGNYKLELDDVKLPFSIDLYYEGSRILGGKITKSDNKVNIIEKGLERVKHDKVEYIASEVGSGEFVSLDKMTTGTYEIIPLNPPEGYYVKDAYPTVKLTDEKPYDDVVVEYLKNNGKKVQLTVSDNTQAENSGKYIIYDYKKYLGLDGGKEYLIDSNQTIELEKGRYLVKAISNEDYYAKAINSDEDHLFVTLEKEIEEVEFEYIKYNGQGPISNVKIYIEDSSKSDNYSYNYTLISKAGEDINGVFDKDNYRTHYIDLPYGYYELTVKDLQAGYKVKPKSFIISSENAEQIFEIVKDDGDEKIDVDFKFVCEGEVVSPVEFTLDDSPLTNGINKVSTGNHKLQITNLPVYFEAINDSEDIIINEDTKDIVIKVNKTNKVIRKITLSAFDYSKKYDDNVDFIVIGEDGKEYRGKVYRSYPDKPSKLTIEYELPVGEYELHVESFDKALQPKFNNYGKFEVGERTKIGPNVDIFPAYKIDVSAKTQYGNEVDLEYKVIAKKDAKIGEFDIDSVPAARGDHEVHAINIPEGMKIVKNPLITSYTGSSYFDGAYKPVEFEVIVDKKPEKHQVKFNYGYDDKVESVEVYEGAKAKEPAKPAREGYEFKGWFTDQALTEKFDFETLISTDITLYAKWEKEAPKVYEVTFVKNNGEKDSVIEVTEGEKVQAPEIEKEGYELEGWYRDQNYRNKFDFETKITSNITLYAKWKEIETGIKKISGSGYDNTGLFTENSIEVYAVDKDGNKHKGKIIQNGKDFTTEFELEKGEYELKAKSVDGIVAPEFTDYGKFTVDDKTEKIPYDMKIYTWKTFKIDVSAKTKDGKNVELEYKVIRQDGVKKGEFRIDSVPGVRGKTVEVHAINIPNGIKVVNNPLETIFMPKAGSSLFNEGEFEPVEFEVILDEESEKHQVTFNYGYDDKVESVEVNEGEKVKEPAKPTRDGYEFKGWYEDNEFTKAFDFGSTIKADTTLYAKWNEIDQSMIKVTLDMQDKSRNFNYENAEVYVVDEEGKEYLGKIYKYSSYYRVDFNLKKGRYEIKARSLDEDSLLPSHNSYGKFNVYSSPKKLPFEYTVFFWKPTKIDVSAVDQDGESVELEYKVIRKEREKYGEFPIDKVPAARGEDCEIEAINIPESMKVIKNPIKTTYDNYNEIYKPVKFDVIVDKESKTFNVTFVKNNETDNEVVEVRDGEKVAKPVDPEKEGYDFVGWFTDEALTEKFDFDTPIESNTTLYAKWEEIVVDPAKFEVTFVKNNETDNEVVEVRDGEKVAKPEDPEKDGYKFLGWFTDEELTTEFNFDTPIEANTTLYAKWEEIVVEPRTFEVRFVKGNGSEDEVIEVIEGQRVSALEIVREGYDFAGWYLDQDLTEKFDFDTRIISNTTLYAKWEKIEVSPRPRPDDWPTYDGHYYEPSPEYKPENSDRTELDENKENTEDETKGQEKPDSPLLIEKPIYTVDLIDIPITEVGDAIRDIVARGILKGTGDNKFEPETTITRAMITEVFMRLSIDKSIDKSINFFDIKFGDWYYDSVRWAAAKSIVKGYEDGTFKPNQKITLQEFAVMLHRMLNKFGVELPKVKDVDENDYSYLLDWCKYEVIDLVEADFIEVNQYGEHAYDKEITREYFAVVMDRLIKYVEANYNTDIIHE